MTAIALIGVGNWGRNILRNLDEISEVSYCCHREGNGAKKFIRKNYSGIETTTDLNDILEDDTVDAVAIATPPGSHFEIAKKVLNSGKDVFIEKPMTNSLEKSKKLEKVSKESGQILFVGYIFLYHPAYSKIKEIHEAEEIDLIRADWRKTGSFGDKLTHTLTCHDIAIAQDLFPENLSDFEIVSVDGDKKADYLDLRLEFNSKEFFGRYNRVFPGKQKSIEFKTEKGNRYIWKDSKIFHFDQEKLEFNKIFESDKEPLRKELEQFINCIEAREKPLTDASFGRRIDDVIQAIEPDLM